MKKLTQRQKAIIAEALHLLEQEGGGDNEPSFEELDELKADVGIAEAVAA